MLKMKSLSPEAIATIYHTHMKNDFPADELKPLTSILNLISQGLYEGFGLFEGTSLRAYAFLTHQEGGNVLLLDYLAVCEGFRGQDYGSQFLKILKAHCTDYKGIIIEIESLRTAKDAADLKIRTKRLAFYERNGLSQTGVTANCFGVEFTILYLPIDPEWHDDFIYENLNDIYLTLFPGKLYTDHVRFLDSLEA